MASAAARLARLRDLVQSDLEALPHRPAPDPEALSDDGTPGGVTLENYLDKQPTSPPVADSAPIPTPVTPVAPKQDPQEVANENPERRFVWKQGKASSYNLGSQPTLAALPTTKLPPNDLQKGELAPTKYFTPIAALSKYPYQFCNKSCMQDIASAFFDAGKFWAREWDLFYVWDVEETKPLILVGETQFEHLLKEINSALKLQLRITNQQRQDGLVNRFPDHSRCLPRYLGRSRSREEYDSMVANVPGAGSQMAGEPMPPTMDSRTLDDFKAAMEEMWELTKNKGKAAKEKKKLERVAKQKTFTDQFKRAQRYLGLRPRAQSGQPPYAPGPIDDSLPAPFPCDNSVVFVCADVESYERAHHKITEIGIATLDTRDLSGIAPGRDGANWRSKIRAQHFRIRDHMHLVNAEFVNGCPERFDFGQSTLVSLEEAPTRVAECFKPPFAAQTDQHEDSKLASIPSPPGSGDRRSLIFLGHDTATDIKYLQQLGFDPLTLPNLLETQDTATMYRVWRREQQPTKLANILYDFDIPGFNLHNAGNDAVFTLQAMLGICVREATIRGSPEYQIMRDEQKAAKLAHAQAAAKQQAEDLAAGWSDNESDGGAPEPIVIKDTTPKPSFVSQLNGSTPTNRSEIGRGRGGGSNARGHPSDSDGAYQSSKSFSSTFRGGRRGGHPERSRFQSSGRAHGQGRGRSGHRGRAREALNSNQNDSFESSGAQVCIDLVDLS